MVDDRAYGRPRVRRYPASSFVDGLQVNDTLSVNTGSVCVDSRDMRMILLS